MKSPEEATKIIEETLPNFHVHSIVVAGEGLDSEAFFVNENFVFRFPKFPHVARDLAMEIALLPKLQTHVTVPIPCFEYIGRKGERLLFVGYRKMNGMPLSERWKMINQNEQEAILRELGSFLRGVHAFPIDEAKQCGIVEQNFRRVYKGDFSRVVQDIYPLLTPDVRSFIDALYETYLEDEHMFVYQPTLLHGDFSADHIFCDEKNPRLTGIIDFGDMSIGDPDYDFMYLFGSFGWEFVTRLLHHVPTPAAPDILRRKLRLFLIHNAIDDVWMGIDRQNDIMKAWAKENLRRYIHAMRESEYY